MVGLSSPGVPAAAIFRAHPRTTVSIAVILFLVLTSTATARAQSREGERLLTLGEAIATNRNVARETPKDPVEQPIPTLGGARHGQLDSPPFALGFMRTTASARRASLNSGERAPLLFFADARDLRTRNARSGDGGNVAADLRWRSQQTLERMQRNNAELIWRNQQTLDRARTNSSELMWRNQRNLDALRVNNTELMWRNQQALDRARSENQDLMWRNQRMLDRLTTRSQDMQWHSITQMNALRESALGLSMSQTYEAWDSTVWKLGGNTLGARSLTRFLPFSYNLESVSRLNLAKDVLFVRPIVDALRSIRRVQTAPHLGGWGLADHNMGPTLGTVGAGLRVGTYRGFPNGTYRYETVGGVTRMTPPPMPK